MFLYPSSKRFIIAYFVPLTSPILVYLTEVDQQKPLPSAGNSPKPIMSVSFSCINFIGLQQAYGGTEFEDGIKQKIHFSQSFLSGTLWGKLSD